MPEKISILAFIEKIRSDAEKQERWGIWADTIELADVLVCDDGIARIAGKDVRAELGISGRITRRKDKTVGAMLRWIGYAPRPLWIDGRMRRAWVRATTSGATLRKPGRPARSKDAPGVKRVRRWHRRPEGIPADDWRRLRREKGLP